MAKNPDDRYPSAGALAADARRALDGATVAAALPSDAPAAPVGPVTHGTGRTGASRPADTDPTTTVHAPIRPGKPAAPSRRRRNLTVMTAIATMAVLIAAVGATQLIQPSAPGGGEVFLEATGTPGQDPFSDTVVIGNPPGTTSQTPTGATPGDVSTIPGDTPALYGGSRNEHVCDRQKLVTFLQQNPDKAAAWAGVLSISVADIPIYVGNLTPMQLRADTRVTNHGFVDGHATTLQSVLQAGTAVLVDDQGRPRVKCGCGNPLLDPVATPITPTYTGDPWPGFDPRNVSAVAQAKTPVDQFVVHDLRTGETFSRPHGTDGDQDQQTNPPAMTTTPPPTPSGVSCPGHPHPGRGLRRQRAHPSAGPMRGGPGPRRGPLRPDPRARVPTAAIPRATARPATPTSPTAPTDHTSTAAPAFPTRRTDPARRAPTRRARSAFPTRSPPASPATTWATPTRA